MPTSLASKVLPDLATGALISLGNFGMDKILGQGWYQNTSERGGFLFLRNRIDQLAAHKNFNTDQKTERTDSCSSSKWWQACDKSHKAKWEFSCYSFGINSYSSSFKRSHRQRYTEQITTVKVCAENITIIITTIIIKSGTKWFAESSIYYVDAISSTTFNRFLGESNRNGNKKKKHKVIEVLKVIEVRQEKKM